MQNVCWFSWFITSYGQILPYLTHLNDEKLRSTWYNFQLTGQNSADSLQTFKLVSGLLAPWSDRAAGVASFRGGVCPQSCPIEGGGSTSGLGETGSSSSSSNIWLFLQEMIFDKTTFRHFKTPERLTEKSVRNPNLWSRNAVALMKLEFQYEFYMSFGWFEQW